VRTSKDSNGAYYMRVCSMRAVEDHGGTGADDPIIRWRGKSSGVLTSSSPQQPESSCPNATLCPTALCPCGPCPVHPAAPTNAEGQGPVRLQRLVRRTDWVSCYLALLPAVHANYLPVAVHGHSQISNVRKLPPLRAGAIPEHVNFFFYRSFIQ